MSTVAPHPEADQSQASGAAKLRLLGLFLLTNAATLALLADWGSPVRVAVVLGFLLLAPGMALTEVLEIRDPVQQLALAAPVSLAVETLVAVALLYTGAYSSDLAFTIVAALTGLALLVASVRSLRSPAGRPEPEPAGASA